MLIGLLARARDLARSDLSPDEATPQARVEFGGAYKED